MCLHESLGLNGITPKPGVKGLVFNDLECLRWGESISVWFKSSWPVTCTLLGVVSAVGACIRESIPTVWWLRWDVSWCNNSLLWIWKICLGSGCSPRLHKSTKDCHKKGLLCRERWEHSLAIAARSVNWHIFANSWRTNPDSSPNSLQIASKCLTLRVLLCDKMFSASENLKNIRKLITKRFQGK